MLSIRWTGQQEPKHNTRWSIPSPRPLYAHIQEGNALVEGSELDLCGGRGGWGFARLLVLLPG